jgi:mannosyltransferase PIG-V
MASPGSVGEEQVPEDKSSAKDPTPEAAPISTADKDTRGDDLLFVLVVCVMSRLFYLVTGAWLATYLPAGPFHWRTPDVPLGTLNIWARWDGAWYSEIALEGYATDASTAFFPLYPLLMRSFAELFGGPLSLGVLSLWGVLISLVCLPFALYFIYHITLQSFSENTAKSTVLILAFFPTTFFFNAAYTESLFLALSAASLWALRVRKDLLLGCTLAAFATATRNVGIFLLVPLAYEWMRGGVGREYGWWRGLACMALAPCGLGVYSAYLWLRFGNPLLFYTEQQLWGRTATDPLSTLCNALLEGGEDLRELFDPKLWAEPSLGRIVDHVGAANDAYNLAFLGVALLFLALGLRMLPLSLSAYAFLLILPPVFFGTPQGPLMGLPRYLLVAFPIFIVLAALLKDRRLLGGWLILSGAASLVLCTLFVSWRFVA